MTRSPRRPLSVPKGPQEIPAPRLKRRAPEEQTHRGGEGRARKQESVSTRSQNTRPSSTRPQSTRPQSTRPSSTRSSSISLPLAPAKSLWLWGHHAVQGALENPNRSCHILVGTPEGVAHIPSALHTRRGLVVRMVSRDALEALLPPQAVHQGVGLCVSPLAEIFLDELLRQGRPLHRLIIIDQITDPHNLGAIIRSACAFGMDGVLLTHRNTPPLNGVVAKSASGALDKLPIVWMWNLAQSLRVLKRAGFWCLGLCERGQPPTLDLAHSPHLALVVGAEGRGLRPLTQSVCDVLVRLPTSPAFPTLNVSTATAVACCLLQRTVPDPRE